MAEYPTYKIEGELKKLDFNNVAGVDEAGRGAGVGPVVAASVVIPYNMIDKLQGRINDSKKLSEKKRNELCVEIMTACDFGVGIIDNKIIDKINILEATKLAMQLAVSDLDKVDYAIIDGNFYLKSLNVPNHNVIKGDALSISIASASVLAKVTRDYIMYDLDKKFPQYGWAKNKGYLTKDHICAIKEYGPCEYHRLSFKKVGH